MNDFGTYLKEIREKRGFGVNQLSNKSGVSSSLISKIENGHRGRPKLQTIEKLSVALKVPFEEIMQMVSGLPEMDEKDEEEKEETEIEIINRETNEYLKLAKTVDQAKLVRDLAKSVFKK